MLQARYIRFEKGYTFIPIYAIKAQFTVVPLHPRIPGVSE
jgi:hypothetical protein